MDLCSALEATAAIRLNTEAVATGKALLLQRAKDEQQRIWNIRTRRGGAATPAASGSEAGAKKSITASPQRRLEVMIEIARAVQSNNMPELGLALQRAEEIDLMGPEIARARALFSRRMRITVRALLARAIAQPGGATVQALSKAIAEARQINDHNAYMADAKMEMLRLQHARGDKVSTQT